MKNLKKLLSQRGTWEVDPCPVSIGTDLFCSAYLKTKDGKTITVYVKLSELV